MATKKTIMLKRIEASCGMKLSAPSKMPGLSFALPAQRCLTGGKLRNVPGSVCAGCYAMKGRYIMSNVAALREANFAQLPFTMSQVPAWVNSMVKMIDASGTEYFRWHDSGDIQSLIHLEAIAIVARRLPMVHFWLPTKEKGIVNEYLRAHPAFPPNLVVRLSGAMVDGDAPLGHGVNTSTVHKDRAPIGHECPAPKQGGNCGSCRACWNADVKNVSYHVH